ncbi:MAG TPA: ABC transporter permease [Thermomicrobiales bacterium]|jgi:molybdate transport system permease protein|nr:ABC transporter permease [Thermomicrobiales bacterium]
MQVETTIAGARRERPPRSAAPTTIHGEASRPAPLDAVGQGLWRVAAGALTLLLAVPVLALVWRAATGRDGWDAQTWATLRQALSLSLGTSAVAMAVIVALGTPLAWTLARRPFPGRRLVDAMVDLPVVLPPAVAGIALLMAFGRYGVVGRWLDAAGLSLGFTTAAVVLAQIFVAAPFYVRAAAGGFARIERDVEEAAADLGAPPGRVFWTITVRLALPSLLAGMVLAWARALGEFGATIMFAGNFPGITQTMPLAIYATFGAGDLPTALLLSLALLIVSLAVLGGARRWATTRG